MNASRIVLDPTAELSPAERSRAPRPASLAGSKIALLDISKPRSDVFLDRLEQRLAGLGARIERFVKPTFTRPAPIDLRLEIATRCDAMIEALAD